MVELCFVLDLRSLPPPFLSDLKQSLLQLANLYAISPSPPRSKSEPSLRDRIGLCFVFNNHIASSDQLKIVYTPSPNGNFSLRDFHHAVNGLPENAFQPQTDESDVKLSSVVNDEVLYHWGGRDIMRKVIVITSFLPRNVDTVMKNTLTAAGDKCISVEFLLFERKSAHLSNVKENIKSFVTCISELDNCSFQSYLPDARVLHGLVNRWLQDLKDDIEEPLQARFNFKENLVGSVNQISCNLYISVNQIVDGFSPCQTCRCHGTSLEDAVNVKTEESCCPVTGRNIGRSEVIRDSVKVGERTILLLPSFQNPVTLRRVSSPIEISVIERTNLGTLSEGVIMGVSYVVIPSAFQEAESSPDEIDQSDLNTELFRVIRSFLHSMDQGLVCSSNCNIETMREATLQCYYILQPSENGPMLLRRIAGSEETLHIPDLHQLTGSSVRKEFEASIKDSLSRIDIRDYDPMLHERGFHLKLNMLVKESLLLGALSSNMEEEICEPNAIQCKSTEVVGQSDSTMDVEAIREETSKLVDLTTEEDKTSACITEEWELLVVNDVSELCSPVCTSKAKPDQSVLSPSDGSRQLDAKTSWILERLEVPRQFKREPVLPSYTSKGVTKSSVQVKKPLLPFQPTVTESQLMKPNFQRLKRKFK